jgi:aspartate ammonia-lyase
MATTRIETDSLGKVELPNTVYYGVHTARAASNFPITGMLLQDYPEFIQSLAMVKKAAVLANIELGELDQRVGQAICALATG